MVRREPELPARDFDGAAVTDLHIRKLDPEWKCWAKCPQPGCLTVMHACCPSHLRNGVYAEHLRDDHTMAVQVNTGGTHGD